MNVWHGRLCALRLMCALRLTANNLDFQRTGFVAEKW